MKQEPEDKNQEESKELEGGSMKESETGEPRDKKQDRSVKLEGGSTKESETGTRRQEAG